MNKLENIITTCEYVTKQAKHVKINETAIAELINNWNQETPKHWLFNNPFGLLDLSIEEIVNFLILLGSIDCSFWGEPKWTITTEQGEEIDRAFALIYAFIKLQNKNNHLDFEQISKEEFEMALKGNVPIPLLEERYKVVREVSTIINEKMNGNFYEYTKNITNDRELFELIINNFPSFEDKRTYNKKTIYFYKLAQLVVSDILHIRELKENRKVDYSHLVGCADYKIPQSLRTLGILEYDEELASLVDNKIEIEENSIYEVEIRASMIIAINQIKKELKDTISAIDINDILWSLGQDKTKDFKPYHRTRTMSY